MGRTSPFPWTPVVAAVVLVAAGRPRAAPAAGADDGLPRRVARIEAGPLEREGRVRFRASDAAAGRAADAFDGRADTAFRTAGVNPAYVEATFRDPVEVESAQVLLAGTGEHEWSLLVGEDPEALTVVVRQDRAPGGRWSDVRTFRRPLRARVFRVVALRLGRGGDVAFGEIALTAAQRPVAIEWSVPGDVVTKGGELPLRAIVRFDGGHRAVDPGMLDVFSETPSTAYVARGAHPDGRPGALAHFVAPGAAVMTARIRGRPGVELRAPPLALRVAEAGLPDWEVTHIERTPRLAFDGRGGGLPREGDAVVWVAHVRNVGTADAPRVPCAWFVDGEPAADGGVDPLDRFATATSTLRLPWSARRREIRFVVDPAGHAAERSRANNEVAVASDALLLGVWVERSAAMRLLAAAAGGDGSAPTFERTVQARVAGWNATLRDAVHPATPRGVPERFALDRVVPVEDGALPLAGGDPVHGPDVTDRTVDAALGFPATPPDGAGDDALPPRDAPPGGEGDRALLRAILLARGAADARRLAVRASEVRLAEPDGRPVAGTGAMPADGEGFVRRAPGGGAAGSEAGIDAHTAAFLARAYARRAAGGGRAPPPPDACLADLPRTCGVRILAQDGRPLDGVGVAAWRRAPLAEGGTAFHGDPVRQGVTRDGGFLDLSPDTDPFFEGRGGAADAGRAVLLLRVRHGGRTCWRFVDATPWNLAVWAGATDAHVVDIATDLP